MGICWKFFHETIEIEVALLNLDTKIFHWINSDFGSTYFDPLMLFISNEKVWVVLSLVAIFLGIRKKIQNFGSLLFVAIISISITDLIAYRVLKPFFLRKRPCYEFEEIVRLVPDGCGSLFGFPSNHASNGMAIAVAVLLVLGPSAWKKFLPLVLLVGFSRIYLGVHYPGDVLAGFVFGSGVAFLVYKLTKPILKIKEPI